MERKTRRRGTELEEAILAAAAAELAESGYANLTMDKVAQRAGTNKNAIYRRWPSRAALGVAAYKHVVSGEKPLPDNGELRADVLELLRRANSYWSSPEGAMLRDLMAGIGPNELLAQVRGEASDAGSEMWLTVLGRAVARGEIRPEALHPRVATVAIALLRNEFLTSGWPNVDDRVLVEIVDEVYLPLVRNR